MATLKVKKIKGREYFYWSKSVRSHKKFGGTGAVGTVDYFVGTSPILGRWLDFHLWSNNIDLQEYIEGYFRWSICATERQAAIEVSIDWKRNKVSLRGLIPPVRFLGFTLSGVDCRNRQWREAREDFQSVLNRIVECGTRIESTIERCAYHLALHDEYRAKAKEAREAAKEARFKPIEGWADADLYFDECAADWETFADETMQDYYLRDWERLPSFAPPSLRSQFRVVAQTRIEKLSKNRGWYEQYKDKVNQRSLSD